MYLELDYHERELLTRLIRQRMTKVRDEFARLPTDQPNDDLRQELETLDRICHRMNEACYDVTA